MLLLQYALGVALGEIPFGLSWQLLGLVLPGVGVLAIGVDRLQDPEKEEWPAAYGVWTVAAAAFLVVAAAWLVVVVNTDYVAGG